MSIPTMLFVAGIVTGAVGAYLGNRMAMGAGFAIVVIALFAWLVRAARDRRGKKSAAADADADIGHRHASHDAGDGADGDHLCVPRQSAAAMTRRSHAL